MNLLSQAIDLRDGLAHYLDRLRRRGRAANTLAAYGSDLGQYVDYVQGRGDATLVALQSQRQVSGWLDALSAARVSERSQARKLTVLRGFFRFAQAEGWLGHDPAAGEGVKFRAKRVIAPEMDALHALVEGIPRASRNDLRDRALLRLALDAAIRIGEAAALDIPGVGSQSSIDLPRKLLHVVGKGGNTETVSINDRTVRFVEEWLQVRAYMARDGETALFVSARGTRVSRQQLHEICKARAKAAGLDAGFTWHMFRHRRIGEIYDALGAKVAQAHARHLHTSTTENEYGHHGASKVRNLIRSHADLDAGRVGA